MTQLMDYQMAINDITTWLQGLPKAELHVHLEGAVSPDTLINLGHKYHLDIPMRKETLLSYFEFTDFAHFLKIYLLISTTMREKEDLKFIAKAHLKEAANQGILYSEVEWTPNTLLKNGIGYREQVDGLISGIREGEDEFGATLRLIPDVIPGEGPEAALTLLDEIASYKKDEVVGFGIGGPETDYLIEDFRAVYSKARDLGLKTTAHAGETAGPEAVWEALINLKVERIGHGFHATKDERLMNTLQLSQIPLDISPTSNLKLKYTKSYTTHPIRYFYDFGIPITLNSDDPALFNQNLLNEYITMYKENIFTPKELKKLAKASFEHSFLPNNLKQDYLSRIANYPDYEENQPIENLHAPVAQVDRATDF